jgi:hypothetical protein
LAIAEPDRHGTATPDEAVTHGVKLHAKRVRASLTAGEKMWHHPGFWNTQNVQASATNPRKFLV